MENLEMSCATDKGAIRKVNQDSVAIFPQLKLAVLADGMGGHKAGEVASRKAIEVVRDAVRDGIGLEQAIIRANSVIHRLGSQNEDFKGMGTTLVAVQYSESSALIANVGDSRLYRFRKNKLKQITVDQTVAQEMRRHKVEEYEGKHISSFEHVLTNALGIQPECTIVLTEETLLPGDIHLLCSDGLCGVLKSAFMNTILIRHNGNLGGTIQSLMSEALQYLAPDNVSILMVERSSKDGPQDKPK